MYQKLMVVTYGKQFQHRYKIPLSVTRLYQIKQR
jgi:hypothetical protein